MDLATTNSSSLVGSGWFMERLFNRWFIDTLGLAGEDKGVFSMKLSEIRLYTFLVLLFAIIMLWLSACGRSDSDELVIHIGTTATTRPHTFMEGGELTGFDIELIRMIAERLPGVRLDFEYAPVAELQGFLQIGRIDMIVNNIARNPTREELFIFSERGYLYPETFLVVGANETRTSLHEFEGAIMGGLGPGNWFYRELRRFHEENDNLFAEIRFYENYETLFMDLELGRIDGTLCDIQIVMFNAQAQNLNIRTVGDVWYSTYSYFMFTDSTRGREIREKVDRVLLEFIEDGTLVALSMEWFGQDLTTSVR
jgi:ABC-type amino acid transport substrate-binding protein